MSDCVETRMMTENLYDRVMEARDYLAAKGFDSVDAAFIVDAELDAVLPFPKSTSISFADVPAFPRRTAAQDPRVDFGELDGVRVLAIRGRVFGHEGVPLAHATLPIRVARALGAKWIAIAGTGDAINPSWRVGDIVFSTDLLNWMGDNPLIGPHDERLGVRFLDMSNAYDPELLEAAENAARSHDIETHRGIYVGIAGPQRGTAAEMKMLRTCGADLAGMSAVAETIVAVHSGLKVLGISVVAGAVGSLPRVPGEASSRIDRILRGIIRENPS